MNAPAPSAPSAPKPPAKKASKIEIHLTLTYPAKENMTFEEMNAEGQKAIEFIKQARTTGATVTGAVVIGKEKFAISAK